LLRRLAFAADWGAAGRAARRVTALLGDPDESSVLRVLSMPDGTAAVGIMTVAGAERRASMAEQGRALCSFEGRLDDSTALCTELGLSSIASSALVSISAYHRWGDSFPSHLRGEFALVLWDGSANRLLAARDPFGVRPLCYATSRDELWAASDPEQFLTATLVPPEPDDTMVVEFLTRHIRARGRTFFRAIRAVPGGHVLSATRTTTSTFDYRILPEVDATFANAGDCYEAFREVFTTAVHRRLVSDKVVLADLSGGRDSSAVVCVADRLLREQPSLAPGLIAANAAYPGMACDESAYVAAVAKRVRIPIVSWDGTLASSVELAEPMIAAPGNRLSFAGGTEGYIDIARAQGASVVLTGLGGDQVGQPFGVSLDEIANGHIRSAIAHAFPRGTTLPIALRTAVRIFDAFSPPWFPRLQTFIRRPRRRPDWLTASVADLACAEVPSMGDIAGSHGRRLRWQAFNDPVIASATDRRQRHAATAALEACHPFLDWDLVTFVLRVPFPFWPASSSYARLHAIALASDLPPEISNRQTKADFTPAVVHRVKMLAPLITDLFYGTTWAAARYVDQAKARRLLGRLASGELHRDSHRGLLLGAHKIWAIASLETWIRHVSSYSTRRAQSGVIE
jgi:asparagine synthase (glutamine-hydrolysing)